MLNRYLDISTEVKEALEQGKPVVALECLFLTRWSLCPVIWMVI